MSALFCYQYDCVLHKYLCVSPLFYPLIMFQSCWLLLTCSIKYNDSRTIVKMPAAIGTGFDCASKNEIQLVLSRVSQIKYTVSNGIQMMTFDSEVELMKVARAHPKAKLVLQIATDDSKAVCHLSVKFGALDIDVIGVNFHVESGCTDPETFMQVISDACCVFDIGAKVGFNMYLLDIGGDFPGSEDYFPSDSGVRIIPELGRYYVASAFTLTVNIIDKKLILKEQTASDDEEESSEQTVMYYMNDGVYGSFNYEKCYSSSIWGPICDYLDHIVEPCNQRVGSWMLFENIGPTWQMMKQIQSQDSSPRVEERDVSPLHPHSADCAPTHINV
ncbi:hypothetical protein FD754_014467 [Muntiacus muntjak]|uniref:Ornithine decarboxylase n=1 Tax=Muntiacus muntjak TaxID=9888 RepID=A0A5N3VJX0_MUNMU|nr:hypothetical protein FD754_014467 [Muntiacus muntjak]